MKLPKSFSFALRLHCVAAAVLPILLLGILCLHYFRQKHLENISNLLETQATNVSIEATQFLDEASSTLFMTAAMISVDDLQGGASIDCQLQAALDASKQFESIYVLNSDHKIIHLALSERNSVNRSDYLGLDMSSQEIIFAGLTLDQSVWSDLPVGGDCRADGHAGNSSTERYFDGHGQSAEYQHGIK